MSEPIKHVKTRDIVAILGAMSLFLALIEYLIPNFNITSSSPSQGNVKINYY